MIGSEEKVAIDGFICKVYRASDFEIVRQMFFQSNCLSCIFKVSKKCQVHLDAEDGRKSDAVFCLL